MDTPKCVWESDGFEWVMVSDNCPVGLSCPYPTVPVGLSGTGTTTPCTLA